ncbi:MAG: serine/threonine-protein kinase [Ferruginibacter sp.]
MIGERIHGYEINAHLGQGGMGNVYQATDTMLGREVALKMLHPQLTIESQFLERFKKEARVLARLLHPNIAVIYNFIEQGNNHFMVMEYVEGVSLDELLKKYRTIPAAFVVPVFIQALEGLHHAHKKNIFHRDIKPSNLMITPDGTLKLMDFGIAKVAGEQKMTQVNRIVGTIEFMAPELIEGKDASVASDIYSMGTTLYELISGKLPFESDTDFNLMQAILKKRAIPPEKLNTSIPKKLNDIVLKAMDKNPANRYADARAFQQALIVAFPLYREIDTNILRVVTPAVKDIRTREANQYQKEPQTAVMETRMEDAVMPPTSLQLLQQKIIKNKKVVMLAAAILLLLIIGGIFLSNSDSKQQALIAQADTLQQVTKNINPSINSTVIEPEGGNEIAKLPEPENKTPIVFVPIDEVTKEPQSPNRKGTAKKPVNNQELESNQKTVEKNEPEQVVEKAPVKKDVYISNSSVEVSLVLKGLPDMNEKKKSDQRVTFAVTRNVVYDGVTIIKEGAIASGSLTIGRKRTDIAIDYVAGANGKQIPVKSAQSHGRREDVESNKSFTAYILEGTRISF